MVCTLLAILLAAASARAQLTVNTLTDTNDSAGSCGTGTCSLRDAITQASAGDTINFSVTGTITLTSALPAITQDTTITGPGADKLTVDGANAYQVFKITGGTVAISGLTIANGKAAGNGGAIANSGSLTVSGCVFSGNSAAYGGAIENTGALAVTTSAFIKNSVSFHGGGIHSDSVSGTVTNSTFFANSANSSGGGIYNAGSLTVDNSTFLGNSAPTGGGGGVGNEGTLILTNSILAKSTGIAFTGVSNSGTVSKEEHNLFYGNAVSDANFALSGTDLTGQDPKLLPLGNYGGTTLTMLPQPGSPAICAGSATDVPSGVTTDQRGFALNAANCGNGGVDAGAVQTNYLMVLRAFDSDDGSCTPTACSLRDAITAANTAGGDIGFNSSLNGSTITVDPAVGALPAISGQVEIVGPGANQMSVGGSSSTVLTVNSGAQAAIYGLTITHGSVSGGNGGGINNGGTLTVLDSVVSGNTASNAINGGGGIYSSGTLAVIDSTISGNTATDGINGGGGIFNSRGTLTMIGSTVSGNAATSSSSFHPTGGGIASSGGAVTVTDSTISGNQASSSLGPAAGGGIYIGGGALTLTNSIVAENTAVANADVSGTYTNGGGNLVGTSGINLAPLGNYGGPTQTMLPLPGSPALCAGTASLAVDQYGLPLTTDQRGFAYGASSYCSGAPDVGAVQTDYTGIQFTNAASYGYAGIVNQAVSQPAAPIVSVTEGKNSSVDGVPVTLTFDGSGTVAAGGLGPQSTAAGLGATFSSIEVGTAATNTDTLEATLQLPNDHSITTGTVNLDIVNAVTLGTTLTNATVETAYTFDLTTITSGDTAPYTYTITSGSLPNGLSLSGGTISGTPTALGTSNFTIQVTDSYGFTVTQSMSITVVQGTVTATVSKPALSYGSSGTITLTLAGASGAPAPTGTVTYSIDGSSQPNATLSGGVASLSLPATLNLAPGSHAILWSYGGDTNYTALANQMITQTVSTAMLTVVVDNQSRAYGAANPTLTGTATGFVNGENAGTVDLSYSTTATTSTPVGSYSISATINDPNYSLNVTQGTLTVTAAPLTVSVNNNSRTYGAPNPAFTSAIGGLEGGDTASSLGLAYSTTASTSSAVGTYSVTATITDTNYSLSVTPGTLTVTAAPMTVSVNSFSRAYGASNPTLTGTVNGLEDSDTATSVGLSYSTTATASSAVGTYPITASITSPNYALTVTPGTLTIGKSDSAVTVSSLTGSSTVNQSVTFTAGITPVSGIGTPTGTVAFTDVTTGNSLCTAVINNGQATCSTASLKAGNQNIQAAYSGDSNFGGSSGQVAQTVLPGASSLAVMSSLDPSLVLNPQNANDRVTLTATVAPSAGVPLSGAVTFTDNGAPIAECQSAIPVNPATGTASCTTASLLSGSHTILAVYNGDPNFSSSSGTATQSVQDYTLEASPTSTVTVSQRFTNTTDLFSPQPITVAATPIAGFTGNLSLTCAVTLLSAPSGAVPPACTLANSSMSIAAGGQQQPVAVTIDAGAGSTPVATAGTYNVSITGVDATTGLTHATASFVVNVRYQAQPLTMVSGATSGNTTTVGFSLPANVGLTDIICASVTGPTLTSSVAPVALSMGCTFTPSTVPPSSTSQDVVVTVAVSTGAADSARLDNTKTAVAWAGLFAVPILAFLGFMPGPKSRKVFFRYLGIVIAAALLFTATGCGGGSFTAPPSVSGQTPPGSYNILVQGTGTDNQTYQAVVQVNVTR